MPNPVSPTVAGKNESSKNGGIPGHRLFPAAAPVRLGIAWNLAAQLGPLPFGVVSAPIILHRIGTDRFGLLFLIWLTLGYLSLFDLGIGRALTQIVARDISVGRFRTKLVWTSVLAASLLGVVCGTVLALSADPLTRHVLHPPGWLEVETVDSVRVIAIGLPIVAASTALRGVLEALRRFDLVLAVRLPLGIGTFLMPASISFFTSDLAVISLSLVIVRVAVVVFNVGLCMAAEGTLRHVSVGEWSGLWAVLRQGGWMSISTTMGPVITYADRFVVAAVLSASAVAYYAGSFEVVSKLSVVPFGVAGVLFPTVAGLHELGGRSAVHSLLGAGLRLIAGVAVPLTVATIGLGGWMLTVWLGRNFAMNAMATFDLLAVGILLNSLAQIPYIALQAIGQARRVALVHMAEILPYLIVLVAMTHKFGLIGAAGASVARFAVDALILCLMLSPWYSVNRGSWPKIAGGAFLSLVAITLVWAPSGLAVHLSAAAVGMVIAVAGAWIVVFGPNERTIALRLWARIPALGWSWWR